MDRINVRISFGSVPLRFGKGDTCPVDQSPAKDFNRDPYTGRHMEEITKVMRAQTQAEQQTAFMNLVSFKGDFMPDETSAKTALKFMKPSLCQLPSELAAWQESLTSWQLSEKQKADAKKADEEYRIELEKKFSDSASAASASEGSSSL